MQWITVIELESQQSLYFFQYDTCSFESKIPFSFAVYHLNFHSLTTAFLKSDYVAKLIQKDNFKSTSILLQNSEFLAAGRSPRQL